MMARLFLCMLLGCALSAQAQGPALDVSVERISTDAGNVYEVSARSEVAAAPAAVWRILTDYERMPEFVPNLHQARVLSRRGDQVVLEQLGEAHFLFFRHDIHLIVQIREQPISRIDINLVDGDMKVYNCSWRLVPVPETDGTRVIFSGTMAPKFYVPGLLESKMLRSDIEKMMAAVMAQLDRPG